MPTLARAENVAFVDRPDEVVVALLPSGPIRVLQGPAVLVWDLLADGPVERSELFAEVLGSFSDLPPQAPAELEEAIDVLVTEGLLTA